MKLLIMATLLCLSNLRAHVPTLGSLLTSPYNPAIKNNAIVAYFKLSKNNQETRNYKIYLLGSELTQSVERVVLLEFEKDFKNNTLLRLQDISGRAFVYSESQSHKKLIGAILYAQLIHNDVKLKNIFAQRGLRVPSDDELFNEEKAELLSQYKRYLYIKDKQENVENPLSPRDSSEKRRVQRILSTPLYQGQGLVKIFKDGLRFYWKVDSENVSILFDKESRKLLRMQLRGRFEYTLDFKNYVLFNGTHEYPTEILLKNSDEYRIQLSKVFHVDLNSQDVDKKVDEFRKIVGRNQQSGSQELQSSDDLSLFASESIN